VFVSLRRIGSHDFTVLGHAAVNNIDMVGLRLVAAIDNLQLCAALLGLEYHACGVEHEVCIGKLLYA
jgi:hypothetical protein